MPPSDSDRLFDAATRAQAEGRIADARRHLEAVAEIDPGHLNARNELGMIAIDVGDAAAAEAHFLIATAIDPTVPTVWTNLATTRRMTGDDEGERAALERALEIDQLNAIALIRLAELHERRGELASAADRWAMVVSLARQVSDPAPSVRAILDHARAFLDQRRQALADAVASGLGPLAAGASARDRRRALAAADHMLGRRQCYTPQPHGLFYPFLPADEYFDRTHFPWLDRLEAATGEIRDELLAILASPDPGLTPYIEMPEGTPSNLWTGLDKSPDWSALHLWRDGERIDEVCARAPRTAALVEALPLARIPGRAPAVFFSILKAGKAIPPHTGVTNVRSIVHLPLIVPEACGFRVGGETRAWREGEAFVFDDTIEHEAWNRSDRDRALLIIDCWNPHLSDDEQAMILRLFEISEAQRPDKPLRG